MEFPSRMLIFRISVSLPLLAHSEVIGDGTFHRWDYMEGKTARFNRREKGKATQWKSIPNWSNKFLAALSYSSSFFISPRWFLLLCVSVKKPCMDEWKWLKYRRRPWHYYLTPHAELRFPPNASWAISISYKNQVKSLWNFHPLSPMMNVEELGGLFTFEIIVYCRP